jgi:hypothetical protein
MTIVIRILDEYFMCAYGLHAVIEAIAAASGLAFDMVERSGVDHGTRGPGRAGRIGSVRDYMQAGIGAERARRVGTGSGIAGIVAGHDPGAGDGVLAKFHRKKKENTEREVESTVNCCGIFHGMHAKSQRGSMRRVCYNPPKPA